jgi:photosystem II stability/assembly factor-like uncharacterized protein
MLIFLSTLTVSPTFAQAGGQGLFGGMRWREIGPYRAGRTRALSGVPGQPATFYIGAVNGGVWKTTDAGQTWHPIFDDQPTGSIGAIAVAPSDPNIIYVGSGEGLPRPDLSYGDGVYQSTDAGKTWTHLGLRDTQQIPQVAVDPRDPNRVFVAALGHPYGANEERGIFRSTDGGKTFKKVLYKDANTGGSDVEIDPNNPDIVYAGLWQTRQGPWENGAWNGSSGGLFKSTDGGDTWNKVTGGGLPDEISQVDIAIAPSNSNRIYATVATDRLVNIYRSDDAGKTWTKTTTDPRPAERIGGGDLPVPKVDPKNPDVLYTCSTVVWKSSDGGKTWFGLRGAPGGDDYQNMWINPNNPEVILLTSDQGAIVSENGGTSWSSWYNQPTAQMYHVAIDNAFPYRACGGQQDSGSACVPSRGDDGLITFHDWHPVGIEEYGYAAPDPLDPDTVFGGKITSYNRRTGQIAEVEPKPMRDYRTLRTAPLVFSTADPHVLFFGANTIWKTSDRGQNWTEISPDLTRKTWDTPKTVEPYADTPSAKPTQRGVVYALAPSPLDINQLWAGTDDGLIWQTSDGGKNWSNVTPPELKPWWKVSIMDASHFDAQTAYAAINTLRLDDMRPHLFRTHDAGKTWTEIDNGIPNGAPTDVIREDPKRKGLLFAGSETQVWVSFDDGDHWQSLRLNMAATSIRDLQIKGDDLIAGTHGRGYMVLDDITPLRQLTPEVAKANAYLFEPQVALRIRSNMNPPTPWPPEMANGQNPPDGAVIDYYLSAKPSGPITLEVADGAGKLVRKYSSADLVSAIDPNYPVPLYWARQPRGLSAEPGQHRFLWDMRYAPAPGIVSGPDADQAVPHDTPSVPTSPFVMTGDYTVTLTAGGKTYTKTLKIVMDPRVKTSTTDLQAQFDLSKQMYDGLVEVAKGIDEIDVLRQQLKKQKPKGETAESAEDFDKKLEAVEGHSSPGGRGGAAQTGPPTLLAVRSQLNRLQHEMQSADVAPTSAMVVACAATKQQLAEALARWNTLKTTELPKVNAQLKRAKLPTLALDTSLLLKNRDTNFHPESTEEEEEQ